MLGNISVFNSYFEDCYSSGSGGAIHMSGDTLTITDSCFINCSTYFGGNGGAVFTACRNADIKNSSFINCSASNGAISILSGDLNVVGSCFINCSGSAISILSGDLNVVDSCFVNCSSIGYGGAIICGMFSNILGSCFINCSADLKGDAIFSSYPQLLFIANSSFISDRNMSFSQIYISGGTASFDSNNISNTTIPIRIDYNTVISSQTFIVGDDVIGDVNTTLPVNVRFTDDNFNLIVFEYYNDQQLDFMVRDNVNVLINGTEINLNLENYSYVGSYSSSVPIVSNVSCSLEYFTNLTSLVEVIIKDYHIFVEVDPVVMYWGNGSKLQITVFDSDGNNLSDYNFTITVNGVSYNKTTGNDGLAYLNLDGLRPNIYNVSVVSDEINDTHIEWNTLVTVLHTINVSDLNSQYKDGVLSAIILDGEGNPVEGINTLVNINGRLFKGFSDFNGKIEFKVDLAPGEYIVTVYDLDTGHNRSSILTISQENTETNEKYNMALVNGEGSTVGSGVTAVFSINGFSYETVTNDKGVVSFDINNPNGVKMITSFSKPFNVVVLDENKVPMKGIHMDINSKEEITDKNGYASSDIEFMNVNFSYDDILNSSNLLNIV